MPTISFTTTITLQHNGRELRISILENYIQIRKINGLWFSIHRISESVNIAIVHPSSVELYNLSLGGSKDPQNSIETLGTGCNKS